MDTSKEVAAAPAVRKEITEKAPPNWREVMSRSQKAFRNRWNTVISGKPKTPKTKKTE